MDIGRRALELPGQNLKRPQDRVRSTRRKSPFLEADSEFAPDAVEMLGNGRDEAIRVSLPGLRPDSRGPRRRARKPSPGERLAGGDRGEGSGQRRRVEVTVDGESFELDPRRV